MVFENIDINDWLYCVGEKMEKNGTEWLCPSCKKEKYAKEREKRIKVHPRSTASRLASRHSGAESANTTMYGLMVTRCGDAAAIVMSSIVFCWFFFFSECV